MNTRGNHIFADYINFYGNEKELGNTVFDLMVKSINKTSMKIVHKKLCILNENTPPGFTAILLLDASHFSSHCYSEDGILALDLFTCGETDTLEVLKYFDQELKKKYPDIKRTYLQEHKRFHYDSCNVIKKKLLSNTVHHFIVKCVLFSCFFVWLSGLDLIQVCWKMCPFY